ncbi:hypothetical protein C0992_011729 [Termitomyces sp. T32_za158]|nr:hypothetical protein C0992_011729 [Termitomyces sp. T32_za158]
MDNVAPYNLNISLEPHLLDALRDLQAVVPRDLDDTLRQYTNSTPPLTIPYSVLRSLSQWATTTGCETLRSHSPPLNPHAYAMIALLAGTTTSPERNFGTYVPPQDPEEIQAAKSAERKSITALLNGLLSVLGSGFAVWWAADRLGWKNEWRVLLALFTSIVVAVSEAVLYLIWQSRISQSRSKRTKPRHRVKPLERYNNPDGTEAKTKEVPATISTSFEVTDVVLRRRQ